METEYARLVQAYDRVNGQYFAVQLAIDCTPCWRLMRHFMLWQKARYLEKELLAIFYAVEML